MNSSLMFKVSILWHNFRDIYLITERMKLVQRIIIHLIILHRGPEQELRSKSFRSMMPPKVRFLRSIKVFSRKSDSTITNVHPSVRSSIRPSVCSSSKPLNSLISSSFINLHSSFIILHSSFLHFITLLLLNFFLCIISIPYLFVSVYLSPFCLILLDILYFNKM